MTGKIDFITFLKGIAILGVVLVHSPMCIYGVNKYIAEFVHFGAFGCQLFFLISGYLMVKSYQRLLTNTKSIYEATKLFYRKRYLSIAPIYIIAVVFYQLLSVYIDSCGVDSFYVFSHNRVSIFLNFVLLHGIDIKYLNNIVPGGWFIGTIVLFYLIFPVLYFSIQKYKKKRFGLAFVLIIVILVNCMVQCLSRLIVGNWSCCRPSTYLYYSIFNQMPCMLFGIMLYYTKDEPVHCRKVFLKFLLLFLLSIILYYALRLHYWIYMFIPTLVGLSFTYLFNYVKSIYSKRTNKRIFFILVEWCGHFSFAAYFTNFIGAFVMPWSICLILNSNCIQFNGNVLYALLLCPIFIITFVLAPFVNILIDKCHNLLR